MTDGISTNQKGLFIALTEAGFADGNNSYRSPCPTGTFFPHLENFLYSTALEAECIPCPPGKYVSVHAYQNTVATETLT